MTVYSWCGAVSRPVTPLASYSPTLTFRRSFSSSTFNLWAAVRTLTVPRLLSLLESLGMMAQVPMKSLFWLSRRQVHGNSPGLASPCLSPVAGRGKDLVPHCLLLGLDCSLQPCVQGMAFCAC